MIQNAIKQERERRIIEWARKQSCHFPTGALLMDDAPDGRIPSATLGIEVSELLPMKAPGAYFSHPQLAAFQAEVVNEASHLFSCICPHSAVFWCSSKMIGTERVIRRKWGERSLTSSSRTIQRNQQQFVCNRAIVPLAGLTG